MEGTNWVAIIIAVLGAGGVGVAVREIVGVITLARQGVSGKEDKRRTDIVAMRDWALSERDKALAAQEVAEINEAKSAARSRVLEESLSVHRRIIIETVGPDRLPPYPI